jgi:hypothetical protein
VTGTLLELLSGRSPMTATVSGTVVTITDPAGTHTLPRLAVTSPPPTDAPVQQSGLTAGSQPLNRETTGG